jgi:hypothetical protein
MIGADFDTAYNIPLVMGPAPYQYEPVCRPPECFVGSYAPITPAGKTGPFFVNTYFLQPNRRREIAGPVLLRSGMFKCNA